MPNFFWRRFNCRAIQINDTEPSLQFIYTSLEAFRKTFGLVFVDDIHKCSAYYAYIMNNLDIIAKLTFLVSKVLVGAVIDYHVIDYHDNFSDHLPIGFVVEVNNNISSTRLRQNKKIKPRFKLSF